MLKRIVRLLRRLRVMYDATAAPFPGKQNCLSRLAKQGLRFECVIDVGVREGTSALMVALPDALHLLFEPVSFHYPKIHARYQGFRYELFELALSNADATAYQVGTCIDGSGTPTHSHLSASSTHVDGEKVVSCIPVAQRTLDSCVHERSLPGPVLLKLDVDGHELEILQGAVATLERVAAVVVEVTCRNYLERAQFLESQGFDLFDVVDLCYFADTLWQMDLVFVRRSIRETNRKLSPWGTIPFDADSWHEVAEI